MSKPLPLLLVVAALAAGCGGSSSSSSSSTTVPAASGSSKVLVGAGSTFVYPLVSQWTGDYSKRAGVTVTYGAVGSGAGIAAITDGSVDFGASDAPLSSDQATACKGCVEIPWALGGTSIAYNVPGAPQHLKLDASTIAGIFLGKITKWNDPAIAKLNPGASLPSTPVHPVFRSDSSGTSYNFTDYLSRVSPEWKSKVGTSTQPPFPAGQGAKGSSGVAGIVSSTSGAITYVDVAYAEANHFAYAAVQNAAGKFTLPDVASVKAAAAAAPSPKPNAAISIVQPPASAASAYPIATFTYVIVPKGSSKATTLKPFLTYAVTTGQQFGPRLLFAPLPPNVVAADKTAIASL
jgi:phosphate transport system substrate-binding protein